MANKKVFVFTLAMIVFLIPVPYVINKSPSYSQETLHAVRVLNATVAYVGDKIAIYNIISNPETWILHNISFSFIITPITGVTIVNTTNTTNNNVITKISLETNLIRISVKVRLVGMKTDFIHIIIAKFDKTGNYSIKNENPKAPLTLTRVKGEIKENVTLGINDASIEIKKKPLSYPRESKNDATTLVILITILLPLLALAISNKII